MYDESFVIKEDIASLGLTFGGTMDWQNNLEQWRWYILYPLLPSWTDYDDGGSGGGGDDDEDGDDDVCVYLDAIDIIISQDFI